MGFFHKSPVLNKMTADMNWIVYIPWHLVETLPTCGPGVTHVSILYRVFINRPGSVADLKERLGSYHRDVV